MKQKFLNAGGRVPILFRWHQRTTAVNIITYVDLKYLIQNGIVKTLNNEMKRINAPSHCFRHILMEGETIDMCMKQHISVDFRKVKTCKYPKQKTV